MADGYLSERFTRPPEERDVPITNTEIPPVVEGSVRPTATVETPNVETPPVVEIPQADQFFENFNKRFGTQIKTDDEIKASFGAQQRVSEYEGKLRDAEERAKKADEYQKQVEEIRNAGNSEFLSKPLIRNAYVAQQLIDKYPDKDPDVLRQIVMADLGKMSDLEVLVKNQKIDLPQLSEADIELALKDQYGIDPDTPPTEWSSIAKTKIAIAAQSARANIKSLTTGIELPKTVTTEERQQAQQVALQKRLQETAPLKESFTKFDKFKDARIEGFEYEVPGDFKSKLGDMFQAMFIDAGMEATPENLESITTLRDAMLLHQEFPKLRELIFKEGQVSVQRKLDQELHNDTPPNTTTATDHGGQEGALPGLAAFLAKNS